MKFVWKNYCKKYIETVDSFLDNEAIKYTSCDGGFNAFYTYWHNELGESKFWCKVILIENEPIAVISLAKAPDNVFTIQEFIVSPKHRGKGYGSAILKELLICSNNIIGQDIIIAEAVIYPDNFASQKVFQKTGFIYAGAHPDGDALYYRYVKNECAKHYDILIDENNDPVQDPQPLKDYMDKWDGQLFIDKMKLDSTKNVLEIGVGTGRLAIRVAPYVKSFTGIDISYKTIERAKENLKLCNNVNLICDNFISAEFNCKFDVIYSSLTFMHIENKQTAIDKIASLLCNNGLFLLSIDKNQQKYIDIGVNRIEVYPDNPQDVTEYLKKAKLILVEQYETEFAHIFVARR
ncbi:MAG: GNAT family N-acetyltransferase [Clostridia bacterium]|nr:GNAT family N-acetyltransferase [Clostridia bacterium]